MSAVGIPDREDYGDFKTLTPGAMVPYVLQHHQAERAGSHYDLRFGSGKMFSFALRNGLPDDKGRVLAVRQPLHDESYKNFSGRIGAGYGAGQVRRADLGEALVTKVNDDKVSLVLAHKKRPMRLTFIKPKSWAEPNDWLLVNHTKTTPMQWKKTHYKVVPQDQVDSVLTPDNMIGKKVDGAAEWLSLDRKGVEAYSYRTDNKGRPIVHTERMGLWGLKPSIRDTVLRAEAYGERDGRAIAPQEVGGILNSSLAKSLRDQQARGISMKSLIFGIKRFKGVDVPEDTPYEQRLAMIREAVRGLPSDRFVVEEAVPGDKARSMVKRIFAGRDPLTSEGIVATPRAGGIPIKVKSRPEYDVNVRDVFPGGKHPGEYGGFTYSLAPDGPIVGKVGTGFSDEYRRRMPELIGRVARIAAQHQFPSGAYRAPSFIAAHEG